MKEVDITPGAVRHDPMPDWPEHLRESAQALHNGCKLCKMCEKECPLLKEWGMPGNLAAALLSGELGAEKARELAFRCNVCGLCTQVCPVRGLDPRAFFQALREVVTGRDESVLVPYRRLLGYERMGRTRAFSFFGLPRKARSVFFPGCALAGARPDTVWRTYLRLREIDPHMGLVLHCCSKPSLQLGRRAAFELAAGELISRLSDAGIEEVLVACPNCHVALREAVGVAGTLAVRTVYELLAEHSVEAVAPAERVKTGVHDPCVLREARSVHEAVRNLLWDNGCSVAEMRHAQHKAVCCGEGGGVSHAYPEQADKWLAVRLAEARNRDVAVYCAGCLQRLAPRVRTWHVLDILLDGTGGEPPAVASGALAYYNRMRLKGRAVRYLNES